MLALQAPTRKPTGFSKCPIHAYVGQSEVRALPFRRCWQNEVATNLFFALLSLFLSEFITFLPEGVVLGL